MALYVPISIVLTFACILDIHKESLLQASGNKRRCIEISHVELMNNSTIPSVNYHIELYKSETL